MFCKLCNEEKEISIPGNYSQILTCGHCITIGKVSDAIRLGSISAEQAVKDVEKMSKAETLPDINSEELISKVLASTNQTYEQFFTSENPLIDTIIKENGKDNGVLILTAIHSHLSRILFDVNKFRNLYQIRIDEMRKDIESEAVKALIQNHDFYYTPQSFKTPKPKSIKKSTAMDVARSGLSGLTDASGKPLDVTKLMANLMWKGQSSKKEEEKKDYKSGLDKIKENIVSKDDEK